MTDPHQTIAAPADADADDAPFGQVMLFVFVAAVVLVTSAVALLSLSTSWWMLGAVFGFHLVATVLVSIVVARALTGRTQLGRRAPRAAVSAGRGGAEIGASAPAPAA